MRICISFILWVICWVPLCSANELTQDNIKWADDYLQENIEGLKEYPQELPIARTEDFPARLTNDSAVAATVKKWEKAFDGLVSEKEKIPSRGYIFVYKDTFVWNTFWKGVLIHEQCHARDFWTKEGCRCDPYYIQMYYYYITMNLSLKQVGEYTGFQFHNAARMCHLKEIVKDAK